MGIMTIRTDDLDGETPATQVGAQFRDLDGMLYEIDLTDNNHAALREAEVKYLEDIADFLKVAQPVVAEVKAPRGARVSKSVPSRKATGGKASRGSGADQNDAIRAWAKSQGMVVADRGRLKAAVVDAFNEAHAAGTSESAAPAAPVAAFSSPVERPRRGRG